MTEHNVKRKEMKMLVYQLLIPLSLYMCVLVRMWDCVRVRTCSHEITGAKKKWNEDAWKTWW